MKMEEDLLYQMSLQEYYLCDVHGEEVIKLIEGSQTEEECEYYKDVMEEIQKKKEMYEQILNEYQEYFKWKSLKCKGIPEEAITAEMVKETRLPVRYVDMRRLTGQSIQKAYKRGLLQVIYSFV